MIVLDASVLIAHLDPGDAHHDAATDLLLAVAPPLLVHQMTLAEVLVGAVRTGRGSVLRDALVDLGVVVADRDADEPLRLAELRVSSGRRLPDCCVLAVAMRMRSPLATFDTALASSASRLGVELAL